MPSIKAWEEYPEEWAQFSALAEPNNPTQPTEYRQRDPEAAKISLKICTCSPTTFPSIPKDANNQRKNPMSTMNATIPNTPEIDMNHNNMKNM